MPKLIFTGSHYSVDQSLLMFLESNGHSCSRALCESHMEQFLGENSPDIVITDETSVSWEIFQSGSFSFPILLICTEPPAKETGPALMKGANDFLVYPFQPAELLLRVNRLVFCNPSGYKKSSSNNPAAYRQLFFNTPLPMWIFDRSTLAFLEVNQAAIAIYGYSREEFLRMTLADIRPPADVPLLKNAVDRLPPNGPKPIEGIWRHLKKDGQTLYVRLHKQSLIWEGKEAYLILVHEIASYFEDEKIKEQLFHEINRAFEELAKAQYLLRIACRTARVGGWTIELPDQKLTWSEEIREIHEVGVDFQPTLETAYQFYLPEYRELAQKHVERCIQQGRPFDFEMEIVTAKSHRIWIKAIGEAIRDEKGQILRLQGAFQDITERKTADSQIEESRRRFHQLANSLPMIIWSAKPDGEVDFANQKLFEVTGVSSTEPPGTRWQRFVHPDDFADCMDQWSISCREKTPYTVEYRLWDQKYQEYRWYRVAAEPIRSHDGSVQGWYGTGTDIHSTKQLQEKAQSLADRLISTLESINEAFFTIDKQWCFTYINREFEKLTGIDRDQFLSKNIWEAFPEAVGSNFYHEYHRAVEEQTPVFCEEFYAPLNKWLEVRAFPTEEGLAVYFSDNTESRHSYAALQRASEIFHLLTKATNDVIYDWDLETNAMWWNDNFCSVFGYSKEEVEPDYTSWKNRVHPDDHDWITRQVTEVLRSGQETWTGEYRFRRKDLTYAYILERGYILRDTQNKAIRMIGSLSDISESRAYENLLRESEERFRKLFEEIPTVAVQGYQANGTITYWNKASENLYGYSATEALGKNILHLIFPEERHSVVMRQIEHAIESGIPLPIEEAIVRSKEGELLTVLSSHALLRPENKPVELFRIDVDLTERNQIEQQLLRAQRLESIGTLAGGIAHDLNNLLSPLLLGISLLRQKVLPDESSSLLDDMQKCVQRGTRLVEQILSFARGMEGKQVCTPLELLLHDTETLLKTTLPKNIILALHSSPDLWPIKADPTQIEQLLLNLCVNARDGMPMGGHLRIRATNLEIDKQFSCLSGNIPPGRYIDIEVSDTGCGIPQQNLERIFDPFFTTKPLSEGTGLGLSTALTIVKKHKGVLDVQSKVEAGTVFRIILPSCLEDQNCEVVTNFPSIVPKGRGELILVVEDEPTILEITAQTLRENGYRVLTALHGAAALEKFIQNEKEVSLVITDLMMPIMDGNVLIRALYSMEPNLPIIAMSGGSNEGNLTTTTHPGVQMHISKPFGAEVLLQSVNEVLLGSERGSSG